MTNNQNKFFKGLPIYFANLDRSPDRYERLLNDFEKYGITEFSRVSAIDGLQLEHPPVTYYSSTHMQDMQRHPYGHFSIFVTYIKMMQEFLKTDYEYALFCDDDIDFYNSTKMDFNFYDTLQYYNPEYYNVRVSVMTYDYYSSDPLIPGKMQRPGYLVVGQASIFNRKWVEKFLSKYNPTNQIASNNFILDLRAHSLTLFTPRPDIVAIDVVIEDEDSMSMPLFKHIVYDQSLCEPVFNKDEMKTITDRHNDIMIPLDNQDLIEIDSFIPLEKQNKFFKGLPIWFVNMDSSTDRYETMIRSFKRYGISEYRRIPAVDGKAIDMKTDGSDFHSRGLTSGEMAANLSYIKLINEFLKSEYNYIMMCDDDVDFRNSTMLNFNFYDTLQYHNPPIYSLKTNALDISYWFDEQNEVPTNELIKPAALSFGNATIINKAWAKYFLKKYGVLNKSTDQIDKTFIDRYTKNFGNLTSFTIPACDAITFDENTYVWKVFGVFDFRSTLNPEYFTDDDMRIQQEKLKMSYNKDTMFYDWSTMSNIDVFKKVVIK